MLYFLPLVYKINYFLQVETEVVIDEVKKEVNILQKRGHIERTTAYTIPIAELTQDNKTLGCLTTHHTKSKK